MFKVNDRVYAIPAYYSDAESSGVVAEIEHRVELWHVERLERELAAAKAGYNRYTVKFDDPMLGCIANISEAAIRSTE